MTNPELGRRVGEYTAKRNKRSRKSKILSILSSIVVFCVTYALILPALTWERTLICEKPEHTHTDSCYTEIYVENAELIKCGLDEHTHTDDCYSERTLVCTESEEDGHVHTDACFERELICDKTEHEHTDECREVIPPHTEKVLNCKIGEHTHTDECFDAPPAQTNLTYCGHEAHTHDESCCTSDGELQCSMTEHTHTKQCYSDPKADLETENMWTESFAGVKLTGEAKTDVTAIALSQLGEGESEKNYKVGSDGETNGYTRYGAWYGDPYADWNAAFCAFCLYYAGATDYPFTADCEKWASALASDDIDLFRPADGYTPNTGDLVFFDTDGDGKADRVGIVTKVDKDGIGTVEGDLDNAVGEGNYSKTDESITGYAIIPKKTAKALKASAPMKAAAKASSGALNVKMIDCWLEVTAIDDDSAEYMITSTGGYALGVNSSHGVTSTAVTLTPVEGYDGFYTANVANGYRWTFSAKGTSSKLTNVAYTGYGLRLNNNTIINSAANETTNNVNYNTTGKYWWINSGSYYLICNSTGTFSRNTQTTNANMKIYKATQLVNVTGAAEEEAVVKPDYPEMIPVSPAKSGTTAIGTVSGTYQSDPATSQIEALFDGTASDDGRIVTDKSVIYKGDDYGAFDTYGENTFGVELSALGQKYATTDELDVSVPLDVVFVLDVSGSMINSKYGGVTSANIMIESLNDIMSAVLGANDYNRVGVVCYSGAATKLLELGRYTAPNDQYFPEGGCTVNTYNLSPSKSIERTDGDLYRGTFSGGWYGTFTQDGIAMGAQEFFDTEDTMVTRTIEKTTEAGTFRATYSVKRRPIFLLLSDGEPTYCTPDFANVLGSEKVFGDGTTGYNNDYSQPTVDNLNNNGILGYYTILSAKYYKDKIAQHYGTDVFFYTIGIGINPDGVNSFANSIAADDYKRAVLNPTKANVEAIKDCTNGKSEGVTKNQDISQYSDVTCHMLYRLLHDDQSGSSVVLRNHASQLYGIRTEKTIATTPIIKNPYKDTGYSYADGSFFTSTNSVETLTKAFNDAINYKDTFPVYGLILWNNQPVRVSDTIGDGMEIKAGPILRYGGENHAPADSDTEGNKTTYHYSGIWEATDNSGLSADLSYITASVEKNGDGRQTVTLNVPDYMLPTYSPNLRNDGSTAFYYEALPVRLIYQVGLTDEAESEIEALSVTGGTKTYYTNAADEDYAHSAFSLTSFNKYYKNNDYDKSSIPKTVNATGTNEYSRSFTADSDSTNVSEILGNNGRLTFSDEGFITAPVTVQKTDGNGVPITHGKATFALYSDPDLEKLVDTFETDEDGILTIPSLRVSRTYYLRETKAPYGYKQIGDTLPFTLDADGKVTGLADNSAYTLGEDGTILVSDQPDTTEVEVEKHWTGDLSPGETYPASATVRLLADGTPIRGAVTLSASNGWYHKWDDLPMISPTDRHPIVYTVEEETVPEGYIPAIENDGEGSWIITNQKIGRTSLSVLKKWRGGEDSAAYVELMRNGEPTGQYAKADKSNGWYVIWDDLPDCDESGPITYSVREIAVDGYASDVHLWTGEGDPYGMETTETVKSATSFTNGKTYLIVTGGEALAANGDGDGLIKVEYDDDTEITEDMLWTASVSGSDITLTNVGAGKKLVMNTSNQLVLGGNSPRASTWRLDTNRRLYASYIYQKQTYNRYFNGTVSDGVGSTNSNSSYGTVLTLYTYEKTVVPDSVTRGDAHYIIVNTKNETPPPDLTLTVRKISSADKGASPTPLRGAVFDLYVETGNTADGLIPGTDGRAGTLVRQYECDGTFTLTVTKDGTYYLVETTAPPGYKLPDRAISFTVTSTGQKRTAAIADHPTVERGTKVTSFDVPNDPTYVLPETGGGGIYPVYIAGAVLISASLMCMIYEKRKRERRRQ